MVVVELNLEGFMEARFIERENFARFHGGGGRFSSWPLEKKYGHYFQLNMFET